MTFAPHAESTLELEREKESGRIDASSAQEEPKRVPAAA